MALKQLLDLEKAVITLASDVGVGSFFPSVSPEQLRGIEKDEYAQVTVWIGYIQWLRDNGFGAPSEPILKPLDTIKHMDAVLAFDEQGKPMEPHWPEADVIVGNPPFLGGKRLRTELGGGAVNALFAVYDGRVPREADLVTYWFERARALIASSQVQRAGLIATQGIRGGANRQVLERIKQSGDIFMAWSDREWVLDGANVHVSIVGFDSGGEVEHRLNNASVNAIYANLTAALDLTKAQRLPENFGLSYMGDTKGGAFDISADEDEAELKKRTLTNLYNQRPAWLDNAHRKLDAAVLDAYGWPRDLGDDEVLVRLLALNAERSAVGEVVGQ